MTHDTPPSVSLRGSGWVPSQCLIQLYYQPVVYGSLSLNHHLQLRCSCWWRFRQGGYMLPQSSMHLRLLLASIGFRLLPASCNYDAVMPNEYCTKHFYPLRIFCFTAILIYPFLSRSTQFHWTPSWPSQCTFWVGGFPTTDCWPSLRWSWRVRKSMFQLCLLSLPCSPIHNSLHSWYHVTFKLLNTKS